MLYCFNNIVPSYAVWLGCPRFGCLAWSSGGHTCTHTLLQIIITNMTGQQKNTYKLNYINLIYSQRSGGLAGLNPSVRNTICTGQGQSWTCRLWCQIARKLVKYFIFFLNTCSCRNILQIFFFTSYTMSKNWCIDVHFKNITSKFQLRHYPSAIPSAQFYCCFRPPKGRRSPVGLWSAVRCSASQNSNQFSVLGRAEYGWWAGSQLCLLFLFFLSGLMAPHSYGQVPETIALYYTPTKYGER
jgi:hypothetical protein